MFMGGDEEVEPRSGEQRMWNANIQSGVFLEMLLPNYETARCHNANTYRLEDLLHTQVPSIFCCFFADMAGGDAVQVCAMSEWYRFESQPGPRRSSWTIVCVPFACIYRRMLRWHLHQATTCPHSMSHYHKKSSKQQLILFSLCFNMWIWPTCFRIVLSSKPAQSSALLTVFLTASILALVFPSSCSLLFSGYPVFLPRGKSIGSWSWPLTSI